MFRYGCSWLVRRPLLITGVLFLYIPVCDQLPGTRCLVYANLHIAYIKGVTITQSLRTNWSKIRDMFIISWRADVIFVAQIPPTTTNGRTWPWRHAPFTLTLMLSRLSYSRSDVNEYKGRHRCHTAGASNRSSSQSVIGIIIIVCYSSTNSTILIEAVLGEIFRRWLQRRPSFSSHERRYAVNLKWPKCWVGLGRVGFGHFPHTYFPGHLPLPDNSPFLLHVVGHSPFHHHQPI